MENPSTLRDASLSDIRPQLNLDTSQSGELERFQHEVLRPLLKFQHPILVRQFQAFLIEFKQNLDSVDSNQTRSYIQHVLKTHKRLRATYFGQLTGLMTDAEFGFYLQHRGEINKRLTQMLIQRLESHWCR